jgi:hypothetical protein
MPEPWLAGLQFDSLRLPADVLGVSISSQWLLGWANGG